MTAQPLDFAPPRLPSDAELVIPRGADPESEILGPIADRYDLGDRIARGGMGIIYRAHDRLLNRTVAMKVMRSKYMDRPDLLRRFLAEARINGKLQHPGIVPVYQVGTLPDTRPFIAMKLIEGQTLAKMLRERSNPAENLSHFLKVFEALCQTMAYAHQQGVIHRDLKPDNVMVGEFGEVQVMDWGLAKFLDPAAAIAPTPDGFDAVEKSSYLSADGNTNTPIGDHPTQATAIIAVGPEAPGIDYTIAGEVFGTLAYMPPEQARGEMDRVDRRGDVFSLGAILCQILTGQPPYYGPPETLREMSREGRLFGAYILLDRCGADQALVLLAKHCLTVDPEARPADSVVLAGLVTDCLEGLQDRTRQIEVKRLKAEARVAEAEAREKLARQARRLARTLAVVGVMVAAMMAAGLGWYANDRIVRNAEENHRRIATLAQIEEALSEAESQEAQARNTENPRVRDSAARQATAACRRVEALVATLPNGTDGFRERVDAVKARVVETERASNLAVELDELHSTMFDPHGSIDATSISTKCQTALSRHGIEILGRDPSVVAAELKVHPAASAIRGVLTDWLAVTADKDERQHLAKILNNSGETVSDAWLAAVDSEDAGALARLAELPLEISIPESGVVVAAGRLQNAGRPVDAQRLLQKWVHRYPKNFAINAKLGLLLASTSEHRTEAVRYLTAARASSPDDTAVNVGLGKALMESGQTDEAVNLLRDVIRNNPKSAEAHARLGDVLLGKGDGEGARKSYAAAVACDPNHSAAQLRLGQLEFARGEVDLAEKAFNAALQNKPNAETNVGLGKVHLKRWEPSKATKAFRASIDLEPRNLEARLGLVEALRMSNDAAGAIREARLATDVAPTSSAVYRVLGDLLRSNNDKVGAAAAYRNASKHDPADADLQLRLAAMCEATGDLTGAIEAYRAAAALRPEDSAIQAHVTRLSKPVETPMTIEDLRQLVTKDPKNVTARHQLGRLLMNRGDGNAISELTIAAEVEPNSGEIRNDLANALLKFGKFRAAASAFRMAAELFPAGSLSQFTAQHAARTAMRWAGLESRMSEILSGSATASSPSSWADFGEVCRRTGRYVAAARFFAKAGEGDTTYVRAAAICAALAGFGHGTDAKDLSDEERADLRQNALKALSNNRGWTSDPDLLPLKDAKSFDALAKNEGDAWRALFEGQLAGR